MRLLLRGYLGGAAGNAHVTTRLEGKRAPNAPGGPAEVHIYEMLWADLARPTDTFLSFLWSLSRLLLSFGSLSRLAVETGFSENPHWKWKSYCSVQRYAVLTLQNTIPLFNVILLIALLSCVPSLSKTTQDKLWFPLAMGGIAGLSMAFLINSIAGLATALLIKLGFPKEGTISPLFWTLGALFPPAFGVALAGLVLTVPSVARNAIGACECWFVIGLALLYGLRKYYENVRGGLTTIGLFLFGVSFGVFLDSLVLTGMKAISVPQATVWTAEWILAALRLSWIFLFGSSFAALVLGSIAWRSIPKGAPARRARARAAVRTSRLALAVPSLLLLVAPTFFWTGVFSVVGRVHEPFFDEQFLSLPPGGEWLANYHLVPDPRIIRAKAEATCGTSPNPGCLETNLAGIEPLPKEAYREASLAKGSQGQLSQGQPLPSGMHPTADYLTDVLGWLVGNGFPSTLILFATALLLLFWWVWPGVLTETFPLRDLRKAPRSSTNAASVRMGEWTSRGLDATSIITFLLWCAVFSVPAISLFWWRRDSTLLAVALSGIVQLLATGATAALGGVVKFGGAALDAILDVGTYLGSSPQNATQRAKIVERYVSLLRYIARYRGPDGRAYDSVVIVAHSLGMVISADLLRFLKAAGDPDLASLGLAGEKVPDQGGISIKFLTMGSPIRQLLNRFFPYLYDWVRDEPDNGLSPLPEPVLNPPPNIAPNALPDPAELGVIQWVNTYRSGDYVGRSIWLGEWYQRTAGPAAEGRYPQPIYSATAGPRREMCIGAGAHTHYWDDTAPDVAEQLNSLI